jgi:hypothetical protein
MRLTFCLAFLICAPFAACSEQSAAESREDFCKRWGAAACNDDVVQLCGASDTAACRLAQERSCLDRVPLTGFVDDRADACIDAVKSAYADSDLTASELDTVLRLGPPCDRLVKGPQASAEACTAPVDCDRPAGYDCVFKASDLTGSCQKPALVQPGRDCSADNAVCTVGFYCNGSNCIESGSLGEACVHDEQCAEGYCAANGQCSLGLAVNAACTLDSQCATGVCYKFSATEQVCTDRVRLSRTDPLCEAFR